MRRLGLLMAFTMTLHNMPEGLAVAFSSYTDFGEVMAVAIAMHNIPEGIIVAAPIFAATGSRSRALLIATLSGLSEPLGALAALVFVKPFLTPLRLQFSLALTGAPRSRRCCAPSAVPLRPCVPSARCLTRRSACCRQMHGRRTAGLTDVPHWVYRWHHDCCVRSGAVAGGEEVQTRRACVSGYRIGSSADGPHPGGRCVNSS